MKVTLAAMGSRGDVQPMLTLACALRARGHDVLVSAGPDFASWAKELGLPFASSGSGVQEWLEAHWPEISSGPRGFMRGMRSIGTELFPQWFAATVRDARDSDVLVSASQFASPSAAEKHGIPCVGVAYSPLLLRSRYHPPIFAQLQGLPPWGNALLWWLADALIWDGLIKRRINIERGKLGLAPIDSGTRHFFEEMPYLLASDPVVAPAAPDWSRFRVAQTGPWFYDDPQPLDPEVEAFLDAGPPPVYVGFGSMVSTDVNALTRAVLDGAGANGRRVLMSKGWAGLGGGELPASVKVVHGPMPHAKLFPRLAAVVHHGGAGTTATALRAGVPQVIVPHMADQFHHAYRLAQLGIAAPGIPVKRLDARKLAQAIETTLALDPAPRLEAAARLRDGNGVARAVEFVEELGARGGQKASDCQARRASVASA
jgi:vancomycin aglycone glucosyltransferase